MKNAFILLLFLMLTGCKKEFNKKIVLNKKETIESAPEKYLKTDTIQISNTINKNEKSYILANLIEKKNIKEDEYNVVIHTYILDFYINKIKRGSKKIIIKPYYDDDKWSAYYGISKANNSTVSSFIEVHIGSINHQLFLFYLNEGKIQFVNQWDTFSDSD